jgi:hypothetical protein
MAQPIIADGRNMYKPEIMRELGFQYRAVGRGATFRHDFSFWREAMLPAAASV